MGSLKLTKTGAGKRNLKGSTMAIDTLLASVGTTKVNGTLGSGTQAASVTGATTLKFGSVSQTLSSLTIGSGATVIFTSGAASGGGDKASGFGNAAASFGS